MVNREGREALRGAEEKTFDLLSEVWTSEEWAQLLKAPLERAARKGDRGIAQKLVGAGAGMGKALHEAVLGGHEGVVNDLLEGGASIADKDAKGDAPVHVAARGGKSDIVSLLMVKGAGKDSIDGSECTPAARRGRVEILRAVLEHGADIDAADVGDYTALHMAAMCNEVEAIDMLVDAGANIGARSSFDGDTPLHLAASWGRPQAVLALLKHGADVNDQDYNSATPLHRVAEAAGENKRAEVVDALLRAGADETLLNDEGEAAADVACAAVEDGGDVTRVQELLANAPADRAWRRRGYLVLCRAHPDRIQLMIQESSSAPIDVAQRARSGTKVAMAEEASGGCLGTVGGSMADERTSGEWVGLVAMVLASQEEGIFRRIVGYL